MRERLGRVGCGSQPDMEIGHPDVAVRGLLVPQVDHVVGCPEPVRALQANAFADARHGCKAQSLLSLGGLVLDFDLDQRSDTSRTWKSTVGANPCRIANAARARSCELPVVR